MRQSLLDDFDKAETKWYDITYRYENVIFEDAEANSEFCKLNPAYTDRIINGCDFQNSVGDPLDCLNTQDVYFEPFNINFMFIK